MPMTLESSSNNYKDFLKELKERVYQSRYKAALSVNKELILLYHHIGAEILKRQKEQGWGAKIIDQLSKDLKSEFPEMKGFSARNLKYMRKFSETYPDFEFVQQVAAQLNNPPASCWRNSLDESGQQVIDQLLYVHSVPFLER